MVWYNLSIGNFKVKYTPIKASEQKSEYCDSEGNLLNYVKGSFESGYFKTQEGEKYEGEIFHLVKGKPRTKLSKTKEVNRYVEVDKKEVEDLIIDKNSKEYLVEGKELYEDLKASGKVLKFGMGLGGGGKFGSVKPYYAYIYPSELYEGFMFMRLSLGRKSEKIEKIVGEVEQAKKLEQLQMTISGIKKTEVEDLIEL